MHHQTYNQTRTTRKYTAKIHWTIHPHSSPTQSEKQQLNLKMATDLHRRLFRLPWLSRDIVHYVVTQVVSLTSRI